MPTETLSSPTPTPTPKPRDPGVCVLCGGPNDCALAKIAQAEGAAEAEAAGGSAADAPCWCVGKTFPAALLAEADALDQGARCICQRCLVQAAGAGLEIAD